MVHLPGLRQYRRHGGGVQQPVPHGRTAHHHQRHAHNAHLRRHDTVHLSGAALRRELDDHRDKDHGHEPAVHHPHGHHVLCGARRGQRYLGLLLQYLHHRLDPDRHEQPAAHGPRLYQHRLRRRRAAVYHHLDGGDRPGWHDSELSARAADGQRRHLDADIQRVEPHLHRHHQR